MSRVDVVAAVYAVATTLLALYALDQRRAVKRRDAEIARLHGNLKDLEAEETAQTLQAQHRALYPQERP